AESVEAEITRYSTKNAGILGSAVEWYSPDGENSNIQFTPSEGNIIDVVANTKEFCIRIYNESSATYKTLETALTRGDCDTLNASIAAGGDGNFDQPDDCPSGFIPV